MTSEVADCIIDAASPVFFDADDNDDQKLDEYEFDGFDSDMSNVDIEELCFDRESSMDGQVPEGSSIPITQDEETGIQTMVMQTMDDSRGHVDDDTPTWGWELPPTKWDGRRGDRRVGVFRHISRARWFRCPR